VIAFDEGCFFHVWKISVSSFPSSIYSYSRSTTESYYGWILCLCVVSSSSLLKSEYISLEITAKKNHSLLNSNSSFFLLGGTSAGFLLLFSSSSLEFPLIALNLNDLFAVEKLSSEKEKEERNEARVELQQRRRRLVWTSLMNEEHIISKPNKAIVHSVIQVFPLHASLSTYFLLLSSGVLYSFSLHDIVTWNLNRMKAEKNIEENKNNFGVWRMIEDFRNQSSKAALFGMFQRRVALNFVLPEDEIFGKRMNSLSHFILFCFIYSFLRIFPFSEKVCLR
jgi:hypothetical protein